MPARLVSDCVRVPGRVQSSPTVCRERKTNEAGQLDRSDKTLDPRYKETKTRAERSSIRSAVARPDLEDHPVRRASFGRIMTGASILGEAILVAAPCGPRALSWHPPVLVIRPAIMVTLRDQAILTGAPLMTRRIDIRLPEEAIEALERIAGQERLDRSALICKMLLEGIKAYRMGQALAGVPVAVRGRGDPRERSPTNCGP